MGLYGGSSRGAAPAPTPPPPVYNVPAGQSPFAPGKSPTPTSGGFYGVRQQPDASAPQTPAPLGPAPTPPPGQPPAPAPLKDEPKFDPNLKFDARGYAAIDPSRGIYAYQKPNREILSPWAPYTGRR